MAATTKILSAIGSKNFPKFVTWLFFLAKYPSSLSVIDAIININSIIHIVVDMPKKLPGISKKDTITIIGTSIILNSVNLFGKFIFVVFLSWG